MTATPLTLIAYLTARPGQGEALQAALLELVGPTRAETECVNHDLHRFRDNPQRFVLYEGWTSSAALDAHMRTPHIPAAGPKLQALAKTAPDGTPFTADAVTIVGGRAGQGTR